MINEKALKSYLKKKFRGVTRINSRSHGSDIDAGIAGRGEMDDGGRRKGCNWRKEIWV
mgnify:CR=1 FL=1